MTDSNRNAQPAQPSQAPPSPAPESGRREPAPIRRPPRPLLRTTLTITPPWDDMGPDPVTIELVVLAEGVHLDDITATTADLPELRHGGGSGHTAGVLSIYSRTVF